jgi:hypothetical protein
MSDRSLMKSFVACCDNDVSDGRTASIIRATIFQIAPMIEAVDTCETLLYFNENTRRATSQKFVIFLKFEFFFSQR